MLRTAVRILAIALVLGVAAGDPVEGGEGTAGAGLVLPDSGRCTH